MKVTAKYNLKYDGVWYMGGEEFEIKDEDLKDMEEHVEFVSEVFPPEKPKRTSKKKA